MPRERLFPKALPLLFEDFGLQMILVGFSRRLMELQVQRNTEGRLGPTYEPTGKHIFGRRIWARRFCEVNVMGADSNMRGRLSDRARDAQPAAPVEGLHGTR